jgi:peptide-methionine (S)-S-oxide reductase
VASLLAAAGCAVSPLPVSAIAAEPATASPAGNLEVATFGSGCFWCAEKNFDHVPGVVSTISGYMGGKTKRPTYKQVSSGRTGHVEVLQVKYDPQQVSYKKLLDYFWKTTDVVDGGGQFCDRGSQYRPVIFTHTRQQRQLAQSGKAALKTSGRFSKPIAVEIIEASTFTAAENYHQNYYKKNPWRYSSYRYGCGRDRRITELWGRNAAAH